MHQVYLYNSFYLTWWPCLYNNGEVFEWIIQRKNHLYNPEKIKKGLVKDGVSQMDKLIIENPSDS